MGRAVNVIENVVNTRFKAEGKTTGLNRTALYVVGRRETPDVVGFAVSVELIIAF